MEPTTASSLSRQAQYSPSGRVDQALQEACQRLLDAAKGKPLDPAQVAEAHSQIKGRISDNAVASLQGLFQSVEEGGLLSLTNVPQGEAPVWWDPTFIGILAFCDADCLCALQQVNRFFFHLVGEDRLWQPVVEREQRQLGSQLVPSGEGWKQRWQELVSKRFLVQMDRSLLAQLAPAMPRRLLRTLVLWVAGERLNGRESQLDVRAAATKLSEDSLALFLLPWVTTESEALSVWQRDPFLNSVLERDDTPDRDPSRWIRGGLKKLRENALFDRELLNYVVRAVTPHFADDLCKKRCLYRFANLLPRPAHYGLMGLSLWTGVPLTESQFLSQVGRKISSARVLFVSYFESEQKELEIKRLREWFATFEGNPFEEIVQVLDCYSATFSQGQGGIADWVLSNRSSEDDCTRIYRLIESFQILWRRQIKIFQDIHFYAALGATMTQGQIARMLRVFQPRASDDEVPMESDASASLLWEERRPNYTGAMWMINRFTTREREWIQPLLPDLSCKDLLHVGSYYNHHGAQGEKIVDLLEHAAQDNTGERLRAALTHLNQDIIEPVLQGLSLNVIARVRNIRADLNLNW